VQIELAWILAAADRLPRSEVASVLTRLREHQAFELQHGDAFDSALRHFTAGGDFADGIIAFESTRAGAELLTFDRKLSRLEGVRRLG
jgi:predicted nucleic-acid-binding protein